MPNDFQLPVIAPLIARHSEDAAFYWTQLDGSARVGNIDFRRMAHFDSLLDAHLEGLNVAENVGWKLTVDALRRWKKVGETFVATWLAVHNEQEEALAEVLAFIARNPDELLRGAISALARTEWNTVRPTLESWSHHQAGPIAQVAAIRAATLIGPHAIDALTEKLADYANADSAYVRAAALRGSSHWSRIGPIPPHIPAALNDTDLAVRAEAAITLNRLGSTADSVSVLVECIQLQCALNISARGAHRRRGSRRLTRWVRELALYAPEKSDAIEQSLLFLPARAKLTCILYRGNLQYLPLVVEFMEHPEVRRYGGWVWQTLTGIELAGSGLTLHEVQPIIAVSEDHLLEEGLDGDNGVALPNQGAIKAVMLARQDLARTTSGILLGRSLDPLMAAHLLETAPQVIRRLVADMLQRTWPTCRINVHAPTAVQLHAMSALKQSFHEEKKT